MSAFNIILIIIILILVISLIIYFIYKNRPSSDSGKTGYNIDIRGQFMIDEGSGNMYYRDLENNFYNAGTCDDCPSACQIAFPIVDVTRSVNCFDPDNQDICKGKTTGFINVVTMKAEDYLSSIKSKVKGQKKMTINECLYILNGGNGGSTGDTGTTPITPKQESDLQQIESFLSGFVTKGYNTIFDFFADHKEAWFNLAKQLGPVLVLQKFIGAFAMSFLIFPMIINGQYFQAGVFTAQIVTQEMITKGIQYAITNLASSVSEQALKNLAADNVEDMMAKFAADVIITASEDAAAIDALAYLTDMEEDLSDFFEVVGFVQMVGVVLDIIDPCGLQDTISENDFKKITEAYNQAFYTGILKQNSYPPLFTAEMVPDFKFQCTTKKDKDKTIENETDPCDSYQIFMQNARNDYFNALQKSGVNALGQCIQSLKDQEFADKLNQTLGLTGSDAFTASQINEAKQGFCNSGFLQTEFNKFMNVVDISLADDNVIVAGYLRKYWYIVFSVILVLILVIFLVK
jgi:hypothetical protein